MSTDVNKPSENCGGSNPPVPDFKCKVCGVDCPTDGGVCEEHCEDHVYVYDRGERASFCKFCYKREEYEYDGDV